MNSNFSQSTKEITFEELYKLILMSNPNFSYEISDVKFDENFEVALEKECLDADVAYVTETIEDECQSIIELLFSLSANMVIIPMHDVLCFGEEARLNEPSTVSGKNWTFRFTENIFSSLAFSFFKSYLYIFFLLTASAGVNNISITASSLLIYSVKINSIALIANSPAFSGSTTYIFLIYSKVLL